MNVTEAAKRMVKFYVGSDAPLIRAFGQELYIFQGEREEAEDVAQKILDLQEKAKRADALEAVAKDFLRRNKYGPLFYRDLYNRFKEVIGD